MSSVSYIDAPVIADPNQLAALAYDLMQAQFPGWVPSAGDLATILIEAVALVASEDSSVCSGVPASIFTFFGGLVGVVPITALPANVTATMTMQNNAGYEIPSGTLVYIPGGPNPQGVPFAVAASVAVAPGSTTTATGGVSLVAVVPGSAGNSLGAVDSAASTNLAFVTATTLTGPTTGGVDAETTVAYLNRLATELQFLTPRPILPQDFAAIALDTPGVQRCLAIDLYQPAVNEVQEVTVTNATGGTFTLTFGGYTTAAIAYNASAATVQAALVALTSIGSGGVVCAGGQLMTAPVTVTFVGANAGTSETLMTANGGSLTGSSPAATPSRITAGAAAVTNAERCITLVPVDSNGNAVSSAIQTEVETNLENLREVNFEVFVISPTYNEVDVSFEIATLNGYDPNATLALAVAAVTAMLQPYNWGAVPSGPTTTWQDTETVRMTDVATVVRNTPGVAYLVGQPELCIHGGSLTAADLSLTGPAALTTPGTVTGNLS